MSTIRSAENREHRLIPYLILLFPLIASLRSISSVDFWMHLAQGREGILRFDTFSVLSDGAPWVNVNWLYDAIVHALYLLGGSTPVIVLHAIAVCAAFAILIPTARKYGSDLAISFAIVVGTWLMMPKLDAQPILIALPFASIMVLGLESARKPLTGWILIGLGQLFWAQMHPSFILGPILCLAYAYQGSGAIRGKNGWIAVGVAAAACLINPYFLGLPTWVLGHMHDTFLQISITGISPLSDVLGAAWFKGVLYASMVLGGLGLLTYKEKLPFGPTFLAVGAAFLAVMSVGRLSYHFLAVLGFLFFVVSIQSIGTFMGELLEHKDDVGRKVAWGGLGLIIVLTLFGLAGGGLFQLFGSASRLGLSVDRQMFSPGAAAFLEQEGIPEDVVHLPLDGGYLRWMHPDRKTFIDTRVAVFDPADFSMVSKALLRADEDRWKALEDRFDPKVVLFNLTLPGSAATVRMLLNDPDVWSLGYFDGTAAVLLRTELAGSLPAETETIRQEGLATLEAARQKLTRQLASGTPDLPLQILGGASLYLQLNRWPESNALFELAAAALPNYGDVWRQLAITRYQIEDQDLALEAMQRAADKQPNAPMNWIWLSRMYKESGRDDESAKALARARALNPELTGELDKAWKLSAENEEA